MLPLSLDRPFFIAPSVFSNVYLLYLNIFFIFFLFWYLTIFVSCQQLLLNIVYTIVLKRQDRRRVGMNIFYYVVYLSLLLHTYRNQWLLWPYKYHQHSPSVRQTPWPHYRQDLVWISSQTFFFSLFFFLHTLRKLWHTDLKYNY